jgi:hypothetical protein
MPGALDEDIWGLLLERSDSGACTPFVGAGACYGVLPLGSELARTWSDEFGFAFGNRENLIEVAQYLAVRFDSLRPKELLRERFRGAGPPDFADASEPHATLADLPLALYVTTNYDDFLFRALSRHPFRKPVRDFCRWHPAIRGAKSPLSDDFKPHPATPLVYHLHGMLDYTISEQDVRRKVTQLRSLVLTEDDYLEVLANLVREQQLLPEFVSEALRDHTCLFIGYRLADWNLRVILEALRGRLGTRNIAVLPAPGKSEEERAAARKYFDEYYRQALDLRVYWGTAREFCRELRSRRAGQTEPKGKT